MRRTLLLLCAVAQTAAAHETITTKLTWTREISRLVYARCYSCHRTGGAAPMRFLTYDETRPWAKAIQEEISERRMPPWEAVKGFGEFRQEASLTPEEIKLFNDWVEGGAPKGDDKYLPSPPLGPATLPVWRGRWVTAGDGLVLAGDVTLVALKPMGALEATAELPDGAVEPLVWIRQFKRPRVYELATPLRLPRGTRIRIAGGGRVALGVR